MVTRPRPHIGAFAVCLLTVCALVPWRTDVLYAGGVDPVVLAKGCLTTLALVLAMAVARGRGRTYAVAAAPLVWSAAFLTVTVLGAAFDGRFVPTAVLAVRVLLVVMIVAVLVSTYAPLEVLHALVAALGVLVAVAAATTVVLGTSGRLHGGLPPLHANELAALAVVCLLWLVGRVFRGEDRPLSLVLAAGCVGVVILTQSRTSLAAGMTALLIVLFFASRVRAVVVCMLAWVPAVLYAVVTMTPAVDQVLTRGGEQQQVTTLANRVYAWQAAVAPGQPEWHVWLGGGLSQKTIAVVGQPWTSQVLDSSWVSVLVQAGRIGLAMGVIAVLAVLVGVLRVPAAWRGLVLALVVFLAMRGFLESGLFDATTAFMLLLSLGFVTRSPAVIHSHHTAPGPRSATGATGVLGATAHKEVAHA